VHVKRKKVKFLEKKGCYDKIVLRFYKTPAERRKGKKIFTPLNPTNVGHLPGAENPGLPRRSFSEDG
jgi:hypothetical protein